MPFDAIQSRPYMRLSTLDLAALVDGASPDLAAIAAELAHRDRKAARVLAMRVASLMVSSPAPAPMPPATVVECVRGEVIPEAREEVVSVERVPAHDVTLWPNGVPTLGIPDDEMVDEAARVDAAVAKAAPPPPRQAGPQAC